MDTIFNERTEIEQRTPTGDQRDVIAQQYLDGKLNLGQWVDALDEFWAAQR